MVCVARVVVQAELTCRCRMDACVKDGSTIWLETSESGGFRVRRCRKALLAPRHKLIVRSPVSSGGFAGCSRNRASQAAGRDRA